MAILDSKFDILRGWPNGSAVAEEFKLTTTNNTGNQKAGKWVPIADGMAVSDAVATSSGGAACALVIEGREDESHKLSGTCTALLGGGYVVRLENVTADSEQFTSVGLTTGSAVAVAGSIIVAAVGADIAVDLAVAADAAQVARNVADPLGSVVGFVLDASKIANNGTGTVDVYIR
jgi:hypothetical protein